MCFEESGWPVQLLNENESKNLHRGDTSMIELETVGPFCSTILCHCNHFEWNKFEGTVKMRPCFVVVSL